MAKKIFLTAAIILMLVIAAGLWYRNFIEKKMFSIEDPVAFFYKFVKPVNFEDYEGISIFQITPGRPKLSNEYWIEKQIYDNYFNEIRVLKGAIIFYQDTFDLHTESIQLVNSIPYNINDDLKALRFSQLSFTSDDMLIFDIMYNQLRYIRTCDNSNVKDSYINIEDCWYYAVLK